MKLNLKNRDGFALPMAILMCAALAAALAASFIATSGEFTTNSAAKGQTRAYNIAETSLQQFLVQRSTMCVYGVCAADPTVAGATDSVRVTTSTGYADVVSKQVRPIVGTADAIYFIRSRGVDTSVKLNAGASTVYAQHTVGVYATWNTMTMKVAAAWVSLSGMIKNGAAGSIDGHDACGVMPTLAGGETPAGQFQGNTTAFSGSPALDTTKTLAQLKASSTIDWNSIVNGNSIAADYTIPQDAFPNSGWFQSDTTRWPVIRIHTNGYSLPNQGRGLIIADSDFTISGSNMWSGIVLVGGKLTSNGNNTTFGATISGLNYLINGAADPGSVDDATLNGQKSYIYDSCSVSKASNGMRKYMVMPNTWNDNVAAW